MRVYATIKFFPKCAIFSAIYTTDLGANTYVEHGTIKYEALYSLIMPVQSTIKVIYIGVCLKPLNHWLCNHLYLTLHS